MRWSKALIPTYKEDPSDAETTAHRLMLRSGLMRKLSSGIYNYLPLGWRAIRKIERIVREEMDAVDGQELHMPVLAPAELWQECGRWDVYGAELMRLQDRNGRYFALGATHEEVVTDIVRNEVSSYKQLPFCVYQIQTKFRDELRPRFGIVRAREFLMKDAYSFHKDQSSLADYYERMYGAYTRVFERCGLTFRAVEAASGAIGGSTSHEFMVLSDTGESEVEVCDCGYAATSERAEGRILPIEQNEEPMEMEAVDTPGAKTIEEVAAFLGVEPWRLVKTIVYMAGGRPVAALVRGDRDVNEDKLTLALNAAPLAPADAEAIEKVTGAPVGFAGPVGLDGVELVVDASVEPLINFVVGGNRSDVHLRNVNHGRDFEVGAFHDIALIKKGDLCARCGGVLDSFRGIEVGQVFQLGTKYSDGMKATFLDETGAARPFVMGCYGIGVSRTAAAVIEQHNDENGIAWPKSVAPMDVEVLMVSTKSEQCVVTAEKLYRELRDAGLDVLLDDREDSPGVKFKDADLIGLPLRVTVGDRGLKKGVVEIRTRKTGETSEVAVDEALEAVLETYSGLD